MTKLIDTITAISTGSGGAIAVIRISGGEAFQIVDKFFRSLSTKTISEMGPFRVSFGKFIDTNGNLVDEVLATKFVAPRSYTGEDMVELSVHGSSYIKGRVLQLLIEAGARIADPGEFTMRAYLNGKLDIVEAEAVADVIASDSKASHSLAFNQMRGGYTAEFATLRAKLLHFLSMLELELDFSQEDVEFANRAELAALLEEIAQKVTKLVESYKSGNAIKQGIPVAIVGAPNSGKSTLLNALLQEERAIVSSIAGTTRDAIEELLTLGDIQFRFIDTAGIRNTNDEIESIGIEHTYARLKKAQVVLLVADIETSSKELKSQIEALNISEDQKLILLLNKSDKIGPKEAAEKQKESKEICDQVLSISAKTEEGIEELKNHLEGQYKNIITQETVMITSERHHALLVSAKADLERAQKAIKQNHPTDLISQEIRSTLHHIGSLTGEITTQDILNNIFSSFCIGK